MTMSPKDHALGMDRKITRRDFLDGVALGAGLAMAGGFGIRGARGDTSAYPPAATGLRGQIPSAFKVMHAIRDGTFWQTAGAPEDSGESYDLVVVGGGISGLAAAFLYRQQSGGKAKILILENHDDFGGHARRNEFTAGNGTTLVGYGGSQSLQTPTYFTPAVQALLRDVGIETEKFKTYYDSEWSEKRDLGEAVFFSKEVFGSDKLVKQAEKAADWVPETPLNDKAKRDLIELIDSPPDYLAGKSREEKLRILSETTYDKFLTEICGYDPQLVAYFQTSTQEYFGVGIDESQRPARSHRSRRLHLPFPRRQCWRRAGAGACTDPRSTSGRRHGESRDRPRRLRQARRRGRSGAPAPQRRRGEGQA
jgi:spermidine dehydrogenase